MDFFFDAVGIFNGEEATHQLADYNSRRLKNLCLRRISRRDTEMRTELVGNGTANFVTGNLS